MIYSHGKISEETKESLGIKEYMNISFSDVERDIEVIETFLNSELTNKEFMSVLGNWGNTYCKRSKTISLLEFINSDEKNAQIFLKFSQDWILMMCSLSRPGFYDDRNEASIKECLLVAKALYLVNDDIDIYNPNIPKKFKYLVDYSLHRTIMQTLTEVFLRGMLGSLEVLGRDSNIEMLVKSYGVDNINDVFNEFKFSLI